MLRCNHLAADIDLLNCRLLGNPTFTPSSDKCMRYYKAKQAAQLSAPRLAYTTDAC